MVREEVQEGDWDLIISSKRKLIDLRLRELWRFRNLVWLLVRRDFVAIYKQTILGPIWHFITPLISTVIFTIIFNNIAGLPTDEIPPFLFYLSGQVIWTYFSQSLLSTSDTFVANQKIFGKVYFPRIVVPVSIVISNLISFLIRLLMFIGFVLLFWNKGFNVHPNIWVLATPVFLLLMAGLSLGWGIIISSFTTKYRDLRHLTGFGIQLLMYISPVIYPSSLVSENYQKLFFLNPISPVIEAFRYAYLGTGVIDINKLIYSFIFMIISLFVGLLMFNRVEKNFMDTI